MLEDGEGVERYSKVEKVAPGRHGGGSHVVVLSLCFPRQCETPESEYLIKPIKTIE